MEILIDRPRLSGETADGAAFGVSPDNPDNTAALQAAFDYAAAHPGLRLTLQPGVYRFATAQRIRLKGAANVEFDGGGAECRFAAKGGFEMIDCERVAFHSLYIDWDWEGAYRLADMVRVTGKGDGYLDFEHFEVEKAQDVPWFTLNQYDPVSLTPGCEGGTEYWDMPGAGDILRVEHPGGNRSRLYHNGGRLSAVEPGEVYCLRYETYGTDALSLFHCHHATVEDVTVWSTPGMAFYVGKGTSHYHFNRCVVGVRPGTNRRMSATTDSMHIGNSCGYGIVEYCDFSFAGDDGINIHDNVGLVTAVEGPRTLVVQKRLDCEAGDSIGVMRRDAYNTGRILTIEKQEEADDRHWRLTFREELPPEAGLHSILYNAKYNSAYYIFRHNYFHENRARALLLGSSHGLVEYNTIYKTQGAAILMQVDIAPGWSEGTGVEDLTVRNNRIIECNVNDWTFESCNPHRWSAMVEIITMLPDGLSAAPVFRDLAFEGNLFADIPGQAFAIRSAGNVRITGNTFQVSTTRRSPRPDRGAIVAECAADVVIDANTLVRSPLCPSLLTVSQGLEVTNTLVVDR